MSRKPITSAPDIRVNGVYHANNDALGIVDKKGKTIKGSHDVIVTSINKRRKMATVVTITSLEKPGNNGMAFNDGKLSAVRSGRIVVIPISELRTHVLSGVDKRRIRIKTKDLYSSTTGAAFPRRYKNLIKK